MRDYKAGDAEIGKCATPDEYIANLVKVFRQVRRALRDDGTLWLNISDSYATGTTAPRTKGTRGISAATQEAQDAVPRCGTPEGLKTKDLIGIPWMLAFALRADGWYLRQDIIWHKPNPMPESVTDRCTKSHEYLFLLSKSAKYYFDSDAMQEPAAASSIKRRAQNVEDQTGSDRVPGKTNGNMKAVGGPRSKRDSFKREGSKRAEVIPGQSVGTHRPDREESTYNTETRNRRSVWTVATQPYKGAHFAVFPSKLITPCILAGSRPGDIVLDPFMGSGTTAQVAQDNERRWIGCELNQDYEVLQNARTGCSELGLELV